MRDALWNQLRTLVSHLASQSGAPFLQLVTTRRNGAPLIITIGSLKWPVILILLYKANLLALTMALLAHGK